MASNASRVSFLLNGIERVPSCVFLRFIRCTTDTLTGQAAEQAAHTASRTAQHMNAERERLEINRRHQAQLSELTSELQRAKSDLAEAQTANRDLYV